MSGGGENAVLPFQTGPLNAYATTSSGRAMRAVSGVAGQHLGLDDRDALHRAKDFSYLFSQEFSYRLPRPRRGD